jgi:N-acetyldiaminopimelate deacetylase
MVSGIKMAYQCEAEIDYGSMYHQVYNDPKLTTEFIQFAESYPGIRFIRCKEAMTGEDFGYMLAEIPGFMFWLGVDSPYGLHHAKLTPNEAAIDQGISFLISYITWKGNN